jgi:hypothetical protein
MQPPSTIIYDVQHWRDRAEEARAMADNLADPTAREAMLQVATGYDQLAERAAARKRERPPA